MDQILIDHQFSPSVKKKQEIISVLVAAENYFEALNRPDSRNLKLLSLT